MSIFDRALKALPFAASIAFITALVYGWAYFRRAGDEWLASLTAQDLFALAWVALPNIAISFVFGRVYREVEPTQASTSIIPAGLISRLRPWAHPIYAWWATLSWVANVLMLLGFWTTLPSPDLAEQLTGFIDLPIILITMGYLARKGGKLFGDKLEYALGTYALTSILIISGSLAGLMPFQFLDDQVALKSGQILCGGIVFAGERGVIFADGHGRSTRLYRWDTVADVVRKSGCSQKVIVKSPATSRGVQGPIHHG